MFAATFYDYYKHYELFSSADLPMFAVGFIASFVAALLAVKALLRFISNHDFTAFAWYRIAFGLMILVTAYFNVIQWSDN
jgi:undecaprenyl-diphosphatase